MKLTELPPEAVSQRLQELGTDGHTPRRARSWSCSRAGSRSPTHSAAPSGTSSPLAGSCDGQVFDEFCGEVHRGPQLSDLWEQPLTWQAIRAENEADRWVTFPESPRSAASGAHEVECIAPETLDPELVARLCSLLPSGSQDLLELKDLLETRDRDGIEKLCKMLEQSQADLQAQLAEEAEEKVRARAELEAHEARVDQHHETFSLAQQKLGITTEDDWLNEFAEGEVVHPSTATTMASPVQSPRRSVSPPRFDAPEQPLASTAIPSRSSSPDRARQDIVAAHSPRLPFASAVVDTPPRAHLSPRGDMPGVQSPQRADPSAALAAALAKRGGAQRVARRCDQPQEERRWRHYEEPRERDILQEMYDAIVACMSGRQSTRPEYCGLPSVRELRRLDERSQFAPPTPTKLQQVHQFLECTPEELASIEQVNHGEGVFSL